MFHIVRDGSAVVLNIHYTNIVEDAEAASERLLLLLSFWSGARKCPSK